MKNFGCVLYQINVQQIVGKIKLLQQSLMADSVVYNLLAQLSLA